MVKLKRCNEAQLDLFSWENPALKNTSNNNNNNNNNTNTETDSTTAPKRGRTVKAQRKGKTYIKRELPIQPYKIIDTFYSDGTGSHYWTCDNCGRVIANIATVEGQDDHAQYLVGMDCAATLSSISQSDIEEWSNGFKLANSIRNKIRSLKRSLGSDSTVALWTNTKCNNIVISGANTQEYGYLAQYFPRSYSSRKTFSIDSYFRDIKEFLKYCPDVAKQVVLNPSYTEKTHKFSFLGNKETTDNFLEQPVTHTSGQYRFVLTCVKHHYYDLRLECQIEMYKESQLYMKTLADYQIEGNVNSWDAKTSVYDPNIIYEKMSQLLNDAEWSSNLESMWNYLDGDRIVKNIVPN